MINQMEAMQEGRKGKIQTLSESRGRGFIIDDKTGEHFVVKLEDLEEGAQEGESVVYELDFSKTCPTAINVKKA